MKNHRHSGFPVSPLLLVTAIASLLCSCTVKTGAYKDSKHALEVSIPQQKMAVYQQGRLIRKYPVSTSKFGIGDEKGSYKTPVGQFEVADKIGSGMPLGAVFKSRKWTGEVLKPNSPGRDPIVSRILWLHGLEKKNKNAYSRCIYIHGTAAERDIGTKASYGCVRMKSRDIIELYDKIGWGTPVMIVNRELWAGIDNPEMPLNEDGSIPLGHREVSPIFENDTPMPWDQLTPALAAREILKREGFESSYFHIEPRL